MRPFFLRDSLAVLFLVSEGERIRTHMLLPALKKRSWLTWKGKDPVWCSGLPSAVFMRVTVAEGWGCSPDVVLASLEWARPWLIPSTWRENKVTGNGWWESIMMCCPVLTFPLEDVRTGSLDWGGLAGGGEEGEGRKHDIWVYLPGTHVILALKRHR